MINQQSKDKAPLISQQKSRFTLKCNNSNGVWSQKEADMMNVETTKYMNAPSSDLANSKLAFSFGKSTQPIKQQEWPPTKSCFVQTSSITTAKQLLSNTRKRKASPVDERLIRRGMLELIEKKLRETIENDNSPVPTLAQALEKHLYKTAPSFREYADSKTLNSRLRLVTVALLRRRKIQQQKMKRSDVLLQSMGQDGYLEAKQLVKQVKLLRFERQARDCALYSRYCACSKFEGGSNNPFKAQDKVPEPVRLLFFRTELVQALEQTPVERIPFMHWDALVDDARSNIEMYSCWDQESNSGSETASADQLSGSDHSEQSMHITAV